MNDRITGTKADLLWSGVKPPSIRDLKLKPKAARAYSNLLDSVVVNGSNCGGRFEEYAGRDEDLPTDEQARLMCVGCASFEACDRFKREGHPAYGVWAGEVRRSVSGTEGQ